MVNKWLFLLPATLIVVGIMMIFSGLHPQKEMAVPPAREATTVKTIILKPGEEFSYQVPPRHWFRIHSNDNVEAMNWAGKSFPNVAWLGDEIRDANFKLISREKTKDAVITITLRPK